METYSTTLENIHGDAVTVTEWEDGSATLDYNDVNGNARRTYFNSFETAYNAAYKRGYRE